MNRLIRKVARPFTSLTSQHAATYERTLTVSLGGKPLVVTQLQPGCNDRWLPWLSGLLAASLISAQAHSDARADGGDASWAHAGQCQNTPGWSLLDLETRRRVFFKYEKRIRDRSAPDKIFHYFASITDSTGARAMTPADLLRSLVPVYPPEDSACERAGTLSDRARGSSAPCSAGPAVQSRLFDLFDVDGDHLISFYEYLLVLTFLSIPYEECQLIFEMFDTNDSDSISLEEFNAVTSALRAKLHHVSSVSRTGLNTGSTSDVKGLVLAFFGPNRDRELALPDFSAFIAGLHDEIMRLEFSHYDHTNTGQITGLDFARSLVAAVDVRYVDRFLDRAGTLPAPLANAKIDYAAFTAMMRLRQSIHKLAVALDFFQNTVGTLGRADFRRAARKVTGEELAAPVVDIVFHLFGAHEDGSLSSQAFVGAMQSRDRGRTLLNHSDVGWQKALGFFTCLRLCVVGEV